MPARLRLSWGMKTLKLFLLPVLDSLEFACQVIRYALIFVSAFFRQRTSLACEMVAIRSQLTFYEESIRQKRQPRPRFHPAFRSVEITETIYRDNSRRQVLWPRCARLCPHVDQRISSVGDDLIPSIPRTRSLQQAQGGPKHTSPLWSNNSSCPRPYARTSLMRRFAG